MQTTLQGWCAAAGRIPLDSPRTRNSGRVRCPYPSRGYSWELHAAFLFCLKPLFPRVPTTVVGWGRGSCKSQATSAFYLHVCLVMVTSESVLAVVCYTQYTWAYMIIIYSYYHFYAPRDAFGPPARMHPHTHIRHGMPLPRPRAWARRTSRAVDDFQ